MIAGEGLRDYLRKVFPESGDQVAEAEQTMTSAALRGYASLPT